MNNLTNKIVVITGSTRGFGYSLAKSMLQEGAKVTISGRSQEGVSQAVSTLQQLGHVSHEVLDVKDEIQVHGLAKKVIEEFGQIDVWVNNAGYSASSGFILDSNPIDALEIFQTNDLGALYGAQAALKYMLPRKTGMLVNIYGNGSFLRQASPTGYYGASKAWLTSLTRTLAVETKGSGLKILGFSPGMLLTDMLTNPTVTGEKALEMMKRFGKVLQILARPPEIAAGKLIKLISTQEKEFVEYKQFKPWTPITGLLQLFKDNLTHSSKAPEYQLQYKEAYQYPLESKP